MSNHTPGPWYFHEQGSACFYAITHFKEKRNSVDWLLSLQHNGEQLLEEERANMRLIAAAPDLLAVCKEALQEVAAFEKRTGIPQFATWISKAKQVMYDEEPHIIGVYKTIWRHNPISGHQWPEKGDPIGFTVEGGGWMPTKHKTLQGAEKELLLRKQILQERALRGE